MGCLRWTRARAFGPGIAAGIRRPSVTPIVPSARRKAGTGGNGAGLAKRTRTCAGLHRSGRRRRSCDDDGGRRGLDATRRLPIRRCCCSPRGTPSARGASPRSYVARCRRLPTETWVGSVSRLLTLRKRAPKFDLVAPPRRPAPALGLPRVGACRYRRGDGLSRRMRARLGGLFGDALARETVCGCGGAALTNGTFARRCLLGGNKESQLLCILISRCFSQPPHHSEGRALSSRASDDDPRVGHPHPPSHAPPRAASQLVWAIRLGAHRRRRPPRQRR